MVLSLSALTQQTSAAPAALRPNILLILADDLGFSDVGCYGSEVSTPNLDRLGAQGARFTQFYNCARCCPSRAALLTGLYPHQAGMGGMESGARIGPIGYEGRLVDRCVTIPEVVKPGGYRCYMVGKWHLGRTPNPIERGFDEFYGMIGGFNSCWQEHPFYTRLPAEHPSRSYPAGQFYSTDAFGDYTLDFLADARKTPEKPWFVYLAFNAAHFPLHAPENEIAKYEKIYQQGWDKIREQRFERQKRLGILGHTADLTPRSFIPANWANRQTGWADKYNPPWDSLDGDRRADLARRMAVYAAMIDRMDQNIGRVFDDLRKHGEFEKTLIIFLSDNGACAEWDPYGFDGESGPHNVLHRGDELKKIGGPESYVSYGSAWANACNTPWRLYKHYDHEGGIATPFIVSWPEGMKRNGKVVGAPCHLIDIMATLVEVTGARYPASFNEHSIVPMEGRSFLPLLKGKKLPPRTLFFEHERNRAVREERWKLVSLEGKPWELYDFERDRSELHDLSSQQPGVVARLAKAWDEWAGRCHVRKPEPHGGGGIPPATSKQERED
ncbi:MAG: arylsulfatase [Verrucomicrobia bacterium]|nr:MAG: arylsulfatase [Verrucomicrobiota bacterium]